MDEGLVLHHLRYGGTGNVAGKTEMFRKPSIVAQDFQSKLDVLREEGSVLRSQIASEEAH